MALKHPSALPRNFLSVRVLPLLFAHVLSLLRLSALAPVFSSSRSTFPRRTPQRRTCERFSASFFAALLSFCSASCLVASSLSWRTFVKPRQPRKARAQQRKNKTAKKEAERGRQEKGTRRRARTTESIQQGLLSREPAEIPVERFSDKVCARKRRDCDLGVGGKRGARNRGRANATDCFERAEIPVSAMAKKRKAGGAPPSRNAFEVLGNKKLRREVAGQKVKGSKRDAALATQKDQQRRSRALLQRGVAQASLGAAFADERFDAQSRGGGEERLALQRLRLLAQRQQRENTRRRRSRGFALGDAEDELTHSGVPLAELEDDALQGSAGGALGGALGDIEGTRLAGSELAQLAREAGG
ncbi:putative transmembrane protein [Toxoplasma gondii FOU]|uniref:Putative transmembrane protein n=1 Tax=Toxoplasma gondii FOU TaxID=943167 RepID=A0A086LHG6_TOXGO|nr:putative transmembrane protein [Toxoplasma gondii FOU]